MAWNEPGGEKRNPWNRPQSQNDLDDVLRNLQRRLAALFGRGGGGGGGPTSPNFGRGLSSVLLLIAGVWLTSGVYRVDAQERAVVLRFGKYVQTVGPGYNWHLPWPIERRIIVNVSQQYSVRDDARMLTADTNLVEVTSAVQYTQPDPLQVFVQGQGCGGNLDAGERERHARGGGPGLARQGARLRPVHHRAREGTVAADARQLRHGHPHHQRHARGSGGARARAGCAARCHQSGQGPPALPAGRGDLPQ